MDAKEYFQQLICKKYRTYKLTRNEIKFITLFIPLLHRSAKYRTNALYTRQAWVYRLYSLATAFSSTEKFVRITYTNYFWLARNLTIVLFYFISFFGQMRSFFQQLISKQKELFSYYWRHDRRVGIWLRKLLFLF